MKLQGSRMEPFFLVASWTNAELYLLQWYKNLKGDGGLFETLGICTHARVHIDFFTAPIRLCS